ncbi:hypothetical protein L596_014467 [Steinernema carpocapsae]|uniref:Uncharacterized protein n=1 Tax=Steinernema carpocapsae TaxID=34508 RepID=A0A4U5NC30_STECR|nr:hypothetical protein L596_014467 [Steinernema carpocapsae]
MWVRVLQAVSSKFRTFLSLRFVAVYRRSRRGRRSSFGDKSPGANEARKLVTTGGGPFVPGVPRRPNSVLLTLAAFNCFVLMISRDAYLILGAFVPNSCGLSGSVSIHSALKTIKILRVPKMSWLINTQGASLNSDHLASTHVVGVNDFLRSISKRGNPRSSKALQIARVPKNRIPVFSAHSPKNRPILSNRRLRERLPMAASPQISKQQLILQKPFGPIIVLLIIRLPALIQCLQDGADINICFDLYFSSVFSQIISPQVQIVSSPPLRGSLGAIEAILEFIRRVNHFS